MAKSSFLVLKGKRLCRARLFPLGKRSVAVISAREATMKTCVFHRENKVCSEVQRRFSLGDGRFHNMKVPRFSNLTYGEDKVPLAPFRQGGKTKKAWSTSA